MKKILALFLFLAPLTSFAVTAVPWQQTNLTDGFIFPALVNGNKQGIIVSASSSLQNFTFTTATGTAATTTSFFSTTASTTNLFGTLINGFNLKTCNSGSFLTWALGLFGCSSSGGGSGTVTQINTTWPITGGPIITTGTLIWSGLATSSNLISGHVIYSTGVNTIADVATSSIANGTGISVTNASSAYVIGNQPTINCNTANTSTFGCLTSTDWNIFNNKQASGNYITTLTGDVTASGPGSVAATLATVNTNVGSFGGTNSIPNFTVNGKGLITAAGANTPSVPASEITSGTFGTGNYTFPVDLTITGNGTSTAWFATTASSSKEFSASANFGALTLPFISGTQCLYSVSGIVSGTGSDCTSGGGGGTPNSKFATTTSTLNPNAISPNGGLNTLVGIGTSTPAQAQLEIASSTGRQFALSDGSLTSSSWGFRNAGGNFYLATSSPSTFATSTIAYLSVDANGASTFEGNVTAPSFAASAINSLVITTNGTTQPSAPDIKWSQVGNSAGIYSPGLDMLAMETRQVDFMRSTPGRFTGFGTSTPQWLLQLATSTRPQLTLSDPSTLTNAHWSFRNAGGNLYIATSSSVSPYATSTKSVVSVDTNGILKLTSGLLDFASSTIGDGSVTGGLTVSGSATTTGTTTLAVNGGAVIIGANWPAYGYLPNDRLDVVDGTLGRNDYSAINEINPNAGTCATSDLTAANDLASNAAYFADLGHTSSGFTGSGCTNNPFTGFGRNSTYLFDPNGWMNFALGSSAATSSFNWFTGGYAATNQVMTLMNSGNLGVGTTTPNWTVQIASSTPTIDIDDTNAPTNGKHWLLSNTDGQFAIGTSTDSLNGTSSAFSIAAAGSTFVGVATSSPWRTLSVVGTVALNGLTVSTSGTPLCILTTFDVVSPGGTTCALSSKYIKHNIVDVTSEQAQNAILNLRPISYLNNDDSTPHYGFVAEEVAKVDPLLAVYEKATTTIDGHVFNTGDPLSVDYEKTVSLIVKYLQDQLKIGKKAARSAEENWQWIVIGLLAFGMAYQQIQIKKLQK